MSLEFFAVNSVNKAIKFALLRLNLSIAAKISIRLSF